MPASVDASAEEPGLADLLGRIAARRFTIGVIGLGYVGLPLALTASKAGFPVLGFDIDEKRVALINNGESQISHISAAALAGAKKEGRFEAVSRFDRLADADAIIIAVPTPLTRHREPDLSYVVNTVSEIAKTLRRGQLVILESTTYPGTTDEVVKPILEATGLKSGVDFFLAFSPEREDPGNPNFRTQTIPKVVGGDGADALKLADALYAALVDKTVPVASTATAEAVKLTENIFRAVNIALVNELKIVYDAMGVDIWDVIEAAKTKPFGYMPFYPGPGLGGHCIPIDPFYLTWKAREFDIATRFIELAGEVNSRMPYYVVDRLAALLDAKAGRTFSGARILVLGLAYKKNIEDIRESPALKLIEIMESRGASAAYHDPYVAAIPRTRRHSALAGRKSEPLTADSIASFDAALIATDHDDVDYAEVAQHARLIIDTRNVCARRGLAGPHIFKA